MDQNIRLVKVLEDKVKILVFLVSKALQLNEHTSGRSHNGYVIPMVFSHIFLRKVQVLTSG